MQSTIRANLTARGRWLLVPAAVAAVAIGAAAHGLPSTARHGNTAAVGPREPITQAHGVTNRSYGTLNASFIDPTPPVFDPGTGGWTGPYAYYPWTDPTPPVFDPGTGGWTGPYGYYGGGPGGGVYDPGTGGWTG